MVWRKVFCEAADDTVAVSPGGVDHPVGRAVEVDAVDVVRADDRPAGLCRGIGGARWSRGTRQSHPSGEMSGDLLGLVGQRPAGDQSAVSDQRLAIAPWLSHELEPARLVSEELARRQEGDILDRDWRPAGGRGRRHLDKAFDAHHARQNRCAVDAVMVEEALFGRIEVGVHGQSIRQRPPGERTEHRPRWGGEPCAGGDGVEPVALGHEQAEIAGHDNLSALARGGDLALHDRHADLRRQHVDPCERHHLGDRAAARHSDVRPCSPVDGDTTCAGPSVAEVGDALAQQVIGRAVVRLATVPEAAGNRAEDDSGPERRIAQPVNQVEPPVALHIENEVELSRRLGVERVADLETCSVQQDVDAGVTIAHFAEHGCHGFAVGEVDLVPTRGTSGSADRVDGVGRCFRSLEEGQFALDQSGCCSFAARRDALGQVALETIAIGDRPRQIGIGRVGFGDEVEEMERAAMCC